jgi:general secretion pathway protein G
MRNGFTIIELIFVIVVLGILASIALPKFGETRKSAEISKGKVNVSAIQSGILNERQARIIQGDSSFISAANLSQSKLFDGVLTKGVTASTTSGHWSQDPDDNSIYYFNVGGVNVKFKYDASNGSFTCEGQNSGDANSICNKLID